MENIHDNNETGSSKEKWRRTIAIRRRTTNRGRRCTKGKTNELFKKNKHVDRNNPEMQKKLLVPQMGSGMTQK